MTNQTEPASDNHATETADNTEHTQMQVEFLDCEDFTKTNDRLDPNVTEYAFGLRDFLTILAFVAVGTGIGYILDRMDIFGFATEAIVRTLAGTADTIGFAFLGLFSLYRLRNLSKVADGKNRAQAEYEAERIGQNITWVAGGFTGLFIALILQYAVYGSPVDQFGRWGVLYAFGYSNLDNFMAGLFAWFAVMINHTEFHWWCRTRKYFRHPFYLGNSLMIAAIPSAALLVRIGGFRPDQNLLAGIESGLMDVDSLGAFVIFFILTQLAGYKNYPALNTDLRVPLLSRVVNRYRPDESATS